MNILTRDIFEQVELTREEQDFNYTTAANKISEIRFTLGYLIDSQLSGFEQIDRLLESDDIKQIDLMICEELDK